MVGGMMREPLVHFALIGVVLYGANAITELGKADPRQITVTQSVYEDLAATYQDAAGRRPTREEIAPLVDVWVDNEVLYREALGLQLNQGDDMIRERVMQKMRVMIGGSIEEPVAREEDLRAFYNANLEDYQLPAFFDFSVVRLTGDGDEARALAATWNETGEEPSSQPGQRLLQFQVRPKPNVEQLLGPDLTANLEAQEIGMWTPVETPNGWAVLRLDRLDPARTAPFEEVRTSMVGAWQQWAVQQAGIKAIADLRDQYTVTYSEPPASFFDPDADVEAPRRNRKISEADK